MSGKIDPKVFFSNERTFLKWLHMSVTIGSISSGLLGFSSLSSSTKDTSMIKVVGLFLLFIAITFCGYALHSYSKRNRLLKQKRGDGYGDTKVPVILGSIITLVMSVVYGMYLFRSSSLV